MLQHVSPHPPSRRALNPSLPHVGIRSVDLSFATFRFTSEMVTSPRTSSAHARKVPARGSALMSCASRAAGRAAGRAAWGGEEADRGGVSDLGHGVPPRGRAGRGAERGAGAAQSRRLRRRAHRRRLRRAGRCASGSARACRRPRAPPARARESAPGIVGGVRPARGCRRVPRSESPIRARAHQRGERRLQEVEPREGDEVHRDLVQVDVQRALEAHGRREVQEHVRGDAVHPVPGLPAPGRVLRPAAVHAAGGAALAHAALGAAGLNARADVQERLRACPGGSEEGHGD